MTRCWRIFGAYSLRLSKRHSTLLLITIFVVIITTILQFYSYRHHNHRYSSPRVGDFEYKPGYFLRGQQPNENNSYCQFNYGLPNILHWESITVQYSPEMGDLSYYRVIYNAIIGTEFANYSRQNAVNYATQATPEFIYHIVEIARFWDGPISLAVFVPNYDLDIAMQMMTQLCHCYSGMSKVSLHLFYPKRHPPQLRSKEQRMQTTTTAMPTVQSNITLEQILRNKLEKYRNLNNETRAEYIQWVRRSKIKRMMRNMLKPRQIPNLNFEDCSGLDVFDLRTYRKEQNLAYPINVGRNVARNASTTNYFIVSDIEMVPSEGLAVKFLAMLKHLMGSQRREAGYIFSKTVFVVPLFEVERGEEIPRDKDTLVRMVSSNRAMYFHQRFCSHCQRFPGLQTWLLRSSGGKVEPMLIAKREYPYHRWEPLYFGTHQDPWYSEILSWDGRQEKMTQMLELCLMQYRMVILDGAFLCHAAVTRTSNKNNRALRVNAERYKKIIRSLKDKYQDIPQCKVMWGCGDNEKEKS